MNIEFLNSDERAAFDMAPELERRLRKFLKATAQDPAMHARLLNTLSFLEHIGSRKIMESLALCEASATGGRLKHLAEETRHAWFFKRTAERAFGGELTYRKVDILGTKRTHSYIHRLDKYICRFVGIDEAYICTSYIVEIRATWFYRIYQDVLEHVGHLLSLRPILAEERAHLKDMQSLIPVSAGAQIGSLLCHESSLFHDVMADLESCISSSSA
jgi:hypothetical protein